MRLRYKTREKIGGVAGLLLLAFGLPFLTAIPIIASIAILHHEWWPMIPLMHYWTAYWWQVALFVSGLPVTWVVTKVRVWLS